MREGYDDKPLEGSYRGLLSEEDKLLWDGEEKHKFISKEDNYPKLDLCYTNITEKKENFSKFMELIKNQFWHGGEKYKLNDKKEFTDGICEMFPGNTGIDWILGTILKYLGRYKNFGREKDLLKIATFAYILWLKGGFHKQEVHDEDIRK